MSRNYWQWLKAGLVLALFSIALRSSPVLAGETTLFGRLYPERWSSLSGLPLQSRRMLSEFGIRHEGSGRLRLTGALESKMIHHDRGQWVIGSIFYHLGGKFDITPTLTLEVRHGSWHNVDRKGNTEMYNSVGLEKKL